MSSCCCGSSSPLLQFLKSQSPDALWQAKLEPKDPFDPKTLTATPNLSDPANTRNASAAPQGAKAPGTGSIVDIAV